KFKTKLDPSREQLLVEALQQYRVNLVVLAGYMRMVKETMLNAFPRRMINVHPSLLPAYPGLRAWEQALLAGERRTQCIAHFLDAGMDTGDTIAQQIVSISPDDTPESLHERIQAAEHQLLPQVIGWFAEGTI